MMVTPPPDRTDLLTVAAFQALLTKQTNIAQVDMKSITRAARDMAEKAQKELVDYEAEKAEISRKELVEEARTRDGTVPKPRVVPTSR